LWLWLLRLLTALLLALLNSPPITYNTSTTRMRTLTPLPKSIELILSKCCPWL
jgi:hypothetical protein